MNIFTIFTLIGGISLLLYGLHLTGEALQGLAGTRLRYILNSVTRNRVYGVLTGALFTALIQSSSATTVMLVGFTSAGLMTLSQSIAVILGADIGTTLTVQLIAFHIIDYALLIIGIGFYIFFASKSRKLKFIGSAIMGFGFIFLSLNILSDSMSPLANNKIVNDLIIRAAERPLLSIILSAVLTALLHSSNAAIGIVIVFASQGIINLSAAIPIVIGANIGTCATALISCIGNNAEAKRVALAHTMFKILGTIMIYPFLEQFGSFISSSASGITRQIANTHTFFNLGIGIIFLPFSTIFAGLITRLIPEKPAGREIFRPRYLDDHVLDSPPLALGQATREALRMADIVQDMLRDTINVFMKDNQELLEDIEKRDDWVDNLDREIKLYITRLSEQILSEEQSAREVAILSLINDLENIGDIIDINLMELARKKIYQGLHFSDKGLKEIIELHYLVAKNFEQGVSAFAGQDVELAEKVIKEKTHINQKERELRTAHIHRLHKGLRESIETSAVHLDVLTNLKRINSHITSIAYPIIQA
ncbi:MAG: Na/Pi cotransporter family protein [Nitrospirota bacterium]